MILLVRPSLACSGSRMVAEVIGAIQEAVYSFLEGVVADRVRLPVNPGPPHSVGMTPLGRHAQSPGRPNQPLCWYGLGTV